MPLRVNDLRSRVYVLIDTPYERDGHILDFSAWWFSPLREGDVTSFVSVANSASVTEVRSRASSLASEIHFHRIYDSNTKPSLRFRKKVAETCSFILMLANVVLV
jgi:hypothetical protein